MNRENAFGQLENLRTRFGDRDFSTANEAKTRLLIIDEVLLLLGWEKEDFNPEHHSSGAGYLDYLLKIGNNPRLVVEAKRASRTFQPRAALNKTSYTLGYLKTAFGPELSEVIGQAQRYGREEDVPYGLVTNGGEWILLQLVPRPGMSEQELKAYCFGDIFSEEFQFDLFFELVSKLQVKQNVISEAFAQLNVNEADFGQAPKSRVGSLNWRQPAEESYRMLGEFYRLFFDEIIDPGRRHMLERCFVSDSKLSQHRAELKRVLKDVAPSYLDEAKELSPGEHANFMPGPTGDQKGTVILLVGSVGAGKSTFVTKVMIERRQSEEESTFVVLDLIDEPQVPGPGIRDRFYGHVSSEWKSSVSESIEEATLRQVFHRELEELRRSQAAYFKADPNAALKAEAELIRELLGDDSQFVRRSLHYFRKRGHNIILVLDNVDRNSEEFQREAYTFAHDIAKKTGATVIVTMRESTFFRGQEQGFLDVRTSDWVFHLQAPDLVQIVAARTRYIERDLKSDHRYKNWRGRDDGDKFLPQIRSYADTLKRSLLVGQDANDLRDLLAAFAWHNVREFFRILHRTHLVLGPQEGSWSFSEVVASLGVRKHHEKRSPLLPSIYRLPSNRARGHFLSIRLLALITKAIDESSIRFGISFTRLNRMLAGFGYSRASVRGTIENLVRDRLLECVNIPTEVEQTVNYQLLRSHAFKASPLGVMMLNKVQFTKPYLATTAHELEIQSEDSFHRITRALKEFHDTVGEDGLDRNALSLIANSDAVGELAAYLRAAYEHEKLLGPNYDPEVEIVERYVQDSVLNRLDELRTHHKMPTQDLQPSLFDEVSAPQPDIDLPIPSEINDAKVGRSEYAPKILWALAALRTIGEYDAFGSQVTEVINGHLVDYPVEPTNVSRALRGSTLQNQDWLRTETIDHRPRYGLTEKWRSAWRTIFNEEPPY